MKRIFGIPKDELLSGPRAVVSNPTTQSAVPPIQHRRWARNGSIPNASLVSLENESLNQAALFRTKTYFQFLGPPHIGGIGEGNVKWRSAFRSGPFAHAMRVHMVIAPAFDELFGFTPAPNSYAQLDLYSDATETTLISSTQFNYGFNSAAVASWNWQQIREFERYIDVSPNTDYYVKISATGVPGGNVYMRIVSACAFELASLTEHNDGYLPQNLAAHQPIVDSYRERQVSVLKQAWEGCGSPLFTWSVDPGSTSRTGYGAGPLFDWLDTNSATARNILDAGTNDTKSTTVTANTPGFYPDLSWHNRKRQTSGVPCVFKAFGKTDAGSPSGGAVELKDSTGAVLATLSAFTPTPQWKTTTVNVPASAAKYDVHFRTNGATTFYLWACVLYPVG